MRFERRKGAEIRMMNSFERFVSETDREPYIDSLISCKPVKRFENRSGLMKFWRSSDQN